ncbi:malonyl-CoA decarboxylase [Ottowia caeni]|uniref:malonyl-CoA decarboxylase n=1 Tax=Ottowia caeni TaxID=2870339 RepID=UPI001E59823E|nr:malonyl-CoA decarboxylase [Ottowia caeni]
MNDEVDSISSDNLPRARRTSHVRLDAVLGRNGEALSPRALRKLLEQLQAVIDPRIGEIEGGRRARALIDWYESATLEERLDLWQLMSEQFVADQSKAKAAQAEYVAAIGTPDEAAAEVRLRRDTVSPRRRILQRISVLPEGVRFLVDMREQLLPHLRAHPTLAALDVEMEYMFSTWFDVGFLELRRMSWDSPASLLEKLIKYEAVHDIRSWADLKNRLDSDRRCYGFFHPRLPQEPLIFVEVALLGNLAESITPLLDESAAAADLTKATTAIFYSISNTQPGLRGVSFGDSLIKRVVDELKEEFPRLKVFATLSPIPGLRNWLGKNASRLLKSAPARTQQALGREVGEPVTSKALLAALERVAELSETSALRRWLMSCGSEYLARGIDGIRPIDPVARFHLGNGARVERLNWLADPSPKGLKQSYGLMVNYLYDLNRLDKHRAMLAQAKIPVSGQIKGLIST